MPLYALPWNSIGSTVRPEASASQLRPDEADLLPALKGEGSLRAAHWFAAYRPHLHSLTAGGRLPRPPRSARPAAGRGPGLQPITPTPRQGLPSAPSSQGLGDMWAPIGASPCGDTMFHATLSAQRFYVLPRPFQGRGLPLASVTSQHGHGRKFPDLVKTY